MPINVQRPYNSRIFPALGRNKLASLKTESSAQISLYITHLDLTSLAPPSLRLPLSTRRPTTTTNTLLAYSQKNQPPLAFRPKTMEHQTNTDTDLLRPQVSDDSLQQLHYFARQYGPLNRRKSVLTRCTGKLRPARRQTAEGNKSRALAKWESLTQHDPGMPQWNHAHQAASESLREIRILQNRAIRDPYADYAGVRVECGRRS